MIEKSGDKIMKMVYFFDEGDGKNKKLLGGKGAGLAEMTRLKLPVPPGFTITTDVCKLYYQNNKTLPKSLWAEIKKNISRLEKKTGKKWNSSTNPLLVSVRSGAALSMPGMMDTILNLGLNDIAVDALAKKTSNPRFAWDSYRRFIQLFGKVVFGVNDKKFDEILEEAKKKQGVHLDSDLNEQSLRQVVSLYKETCQKHTGRPFPTSPDEQLELSVKAVFNSWMGERAIVYREKNHITRDIADGTAVNVVTMVFGNMGNDSATCRVYKKPRRRHKQDFWRIPDKRAGRGRGGRRQNRKASRRDENRNAKKLQTIGRYLQKARKTLQRTAGYRVYNRAGKILPASDKICKDECRRDDQDIS